MTLYKLLGITDEEVQKLETLISIVDTLQVKDDLEESLFQFSPSLNMKDHGPKHEPWGTFYIDICTNEIIFCLIDELLTYECDVEFHTNEQIYNKSYSKFVDELLQTYNENTTHLMIYHFFNAYFEENEVLPYED